MNPPTPDATGLLYRAGLWLDGYRFGLRLAERGSVVSVGDGIAWISGLPSAAIDDVLVFDDGSRGSVFDLDPERVGAVLLEATDSLTAGMGVQLAGEPLRVPVGDALLGLS